MVIVTPKAQTLIISPDSKAMATVKVPSVSVNAETREFLFDARNGNNVEFTAVNWWTWEDGQVVLWEDNQEVGQQ